MRKFACCVKLKLTNVQIPQKRLVHGWEKFLPALALTFLPGYAWVLLSEIYKLLPAICTSPSLEDYKALPLKSDSNLNLFEPHPPTPSFPLFSHMIQI